MIHARGPTTLLIGLALVLAAACSENQADRGVGQVGGGALDAGNSGGQSAGGGVDAPWESAGGTGGEDAGVDATSDAPSVDAAGTGGDEAGVDATSEEIGVFHLVGLGDTSLPNVYQNSVWAKGGGESVPWLAIGAFGEDFTHPSVGIDSSNPLVAYLGVRPASVALGCESTSGTGARCCSM